MEQIWIKKNDILENILIEKLVFWWKWFARLKHSNPDLDGRVIFVTWWAIPWTIANLRVLKKKKAFLETQIIEIVKKSPIEVENKENKYWMSWGWKWINIPYEEQLKIKQEQIKESLNIVEKKQANLNFLPIQWSPIINIFQKNLILKNILMFDFINNENFQK